MEEALRRGVNPSIIKKATGAFVTLVDEYYPSSSRTVPGDDLSRALLLRPSTGRQTLPLVEASGLPVESSTASAPASPGIHTEAGPGAANISDFSSQVRGTHYASPAKGEYYKQIGLQIGPQLYHKIRKKDKCFHQT